MAGDLSEELLRVVNLTITYSPPASAPVRALRDASLKINESEVIGILGESGCGKSTLASAILRLLPSYAHNDTGSIVFRGSDLLTVGSASATSCWPAGVVTCVRSSTKWFTSSA